MGIETYVLFYSVFRFWVGLLFVPVSCITFLCLVLVVMVFVVLNRGCFCCAEKKKQRVWLWHGSTWVMWQSVPMLNTTPSIWYQKVVCVSALEYRCREKREKERKEEGGERIFFLKIKIIRHGLKPSVIPFFFPFIFPMSHQ